MKSICMMEVIIMAIYDLRVCDVKNPLNAGEELVFSYKSSKIAPSGTLVTVVNSEGSVMWRWRS